MNKPIPYGRQNITPEDIEAVVETLRSDYLTQGPRIPEFERKFADYVGAPYAVAVNNATSGLHIAAKALDVKPGDRVIVTPMTFAASANCIRYCGGAVTFAQASSKPPRGGLRWLAGGVCSPPSASPLGARQAGRGGGRRGQDNRARSA